MKVHIMKLHKIRGVWRHKKTACGLKLKATTALHWSTTGPSVASCKNCLRVWKAAR